MNRLPLIALLFAVPALAPAQTPAQNWAAMLSALKTAPPGATVTLPPGTYPAETLSFTGPSATNRVVIDMTGAIFPTLNISGAVNLIVSGPAAANGTWYGFWIAHATNVSLTGWKVQGGALAAAVAIGDGSTQISVSNGEASGHTGDCIDLNDATYVTITGNYCHDNVQIPGKSPHPDVVQLWSIISSSGVCEPTTDITVMNNRGEGNTQGIDTFGTPPGCPLQRVVIENNDIQTQGWWCYGFGYVEGSILMGNTCEAIDGTTTAGIDLYDLAAGDCVTNNTVNGKPWATYPTNGCGAAGGAPTAKPGGGNVAPGRNVPS